MEFLPPNDQPGMPYLDPGPGQTTGEPDMPLLMNAQYGQPIPDSDVYHTGGYWLVGSEVMNGAFPTDHLIDVVFDPLEELIWCITRMGQLTAFYSVSLDRYITTAVPLLPTNRSSQILNYGEMKQVFPSPRPTEHAVYVLTSNALHSYTKFGRLCTTASDKSMLELECLTVTGPTGAAPGVVNGVWGSANEAEFSRVFLGGLQTNVVELDAMERWGEVIQTVDVGVGGSVVLRPFSSGLCAGNTSGKVLVIDPRSPQSIVRSLDAHTGEISDITVVPHGYTLVTCGWSRMGETGLRVDRLLKVYDLRSGRAQVPLSTSLDPCFTRFFPGCTDRLFVASQTGAFQSIQWGNLTFSPDDLGQLWLTYDRVVAMDISHNGNCAIFGTENGQLQLYVRDMNVCQFNVNPAPTEFASQLSESLLITNGLGTSVVPNYPFWDDPMLTTIQPGYQVNPLAVLGRAAAEAVGLQLLAASLHQPAATSSDKISTQELVELVDRKKAEAANEAILVAYKPVEYDDYRFSSASIPFAFQPPPVDTDTTKQPGVGSSDATIYRSSQKTEQMTSSDWSEDLCPLRPRPMLPVDPELVISANRKRAVRKPANWGTVWHPYSPLGPDGSTFENEDTTLGRFVNVSHAAESQVT